MGSFALIAIIIGLLTLAGLILWVRSREAAGASSGVDAMLSRVPQASENTTSAVLVTSMGALIHSNDLALNWMGMTGAEPDLEDVVGMIQPADNFFDLLTKESATSFQLNGRWVKATSHYVPAQDGARMIVVMRELVQTSQDSTDSPEQVMDVSKAMSIINDIGATVNAGMGIELALQVLLEILNRAIPSDAGEICIYDPVRKFLMQRGWIGDTRYLLTVASHGGGYEEGQGIAGWMWQHRKPVLINGQRDPVSVRSLLKDNPYLSAIGVPIWLGEDFIGTLTMFSDHAGTYRPEDMSLMQAVSNAVGMAIRNAEMYAKQEDRIRDIASLQQIAEQPKGEGGAAAIYALLNERMAKLLDADMCGVLLYDDVRQALMPQLPFYGLPDHVADKIIIPMNTGSSQFDIWRNQPYWVSNDVRDEPLLETLQLGGIVEAAGIDNTALFPMQIAGERIGIMAISNTKNGFMPNDIQNLRVLSSQAAIVVENLRLYERERRIDNELVGLQEMTYAIGALSHEGEFYHEITERIARLMNSQMCGVLLYDANREALVSQLPFFGVDAELVADYVINLPPGSVMEQLWQDENFWLSNVVMTDSLVFVAGLEDLAEKIGVEKTLVAVVSAGGRRIGVVQVSNKLSRSDYDDKDARLLQIFATQAGAIIENARLYHEVQVRADQAESLRRVAELASTTMTTEQSFKPVLSEIAELTNSHLVYINVIDHNTNTLITYPRWVYGIDIDEPVVQDLNQPGYEHIPARTGEHFITNDLAADKRVLAGYQRIGERFGIKNSAIVPLTVGDHILGELGVANRRRGVYTEEDLATFSTVAAQIASSVERLLLYEATGENLRRRVEELDSIARVSNQLAITVELDKVLEVIREEAEKSTYADYASIVLLRPIASWQKPDRPEMDKRIGAIDGLVDLAPIEKAAILRGSEPTVVHDYDADKTLAAVPTSVRSAVAAAIFYQEDVVGVIHAYDNDLNAFDERAAGFLVTLATKASLAYQNALLYNQQMERGEILRRRVDQLNRIFELGQMVQSDTDPVMVLEAIAYSIQQSVGFDSVLMTLFDEEDQVLRRVAQAGLPLMAFIESQQKTLTRDQLTAILRDEYRVSESYFFPIEKVENWYTPGVNTLSASYEDNRSMEARNKDWWHDGDMLFVAINGQNNQLLGLISLDRPYDNLRPQRGTIEVLEIFAHQASNLVENTRIFRESQRSAEQEATLNDTLESISGTLDLQDMAVALATGIRDLVSFDRLTLVLVNDQDEAFDYLRVTFNEEGDPELNENQHSTLERTALGRTYNEREVQTFTAADVEVKNYDDLRTWYGQGEKSTIILPLASGGTSLGALHLGSNDPQLMIGQDVRQVLLRTSQIVASTVQNARLFNQTMNLQILNRSVVESIQQGIVVLDSSGHIISINDYMKKQYGWEDKARGKDLFGYQPDLAEFLTDDLRNVLENGEQAEHINKPSGTAKNSIVRNFYLYPLRSGEQIRGAVLLVEDVTERVRLEEAIENRANQLAALTEVSTRITASLEREEVIELAMDEMGWIIPFDTMTMWRRNGSFMVLEGGTGFDEVLPTGFRFRFGDYEQIQQIVETQRVFNLSGDNDQMPKLGFSGDEFIHSWLGVPLVNQGHVVGMFILTKDEPDAYSTRQEHHVAFAFASQVAIALANADLFEQTFERTNELGTLLEAAQSTSLTRDLHDVFRTVAELMFSALEMENCIILIWDEVDNELEVQFSGNRTGDNELLLPVGTRYSVSNYPARQKALRDREVVVIVDVEDEKRLPPYPFELEEMRASGSGARMIVPLVVRDQAIGIIQLEQVSNDEEGISQQKVRLARALGSQVAVAIENARLTTETTARFEELLTINQLSQSISSTLKLEDMMPIIREQVPQVTSAEELYLALYNAAEQKITFPLAVRSNGEEFYIPTRELGDDEVSYIIKRKHSLSLGADYFSIDELRRSMKITNGEGEIKAYMGVPLKSGAEVLGVLAIRNMERKRAFTLNDDRILTTVGSQLGAAIQNARLFERIQEAAETLEGLVKERTDELEEERDRLDTLYQITSELARTLDMEQLLDRSLGMVSKAVGADDGVIMLNDPATDNLYSRASINPDNLIYLEDEDVRTHPAEGLATWLIHQDETDEPVVVIDDLNEMDYWGDEGRATGLRSALAVMLENNEDPMGVMVLLAKEPGTFTEAHLKLLVPAANQVAAAINSADLYQLIRDQAERMGKLLRSEQEEAQKNSAILESIGDGVMLANSSGEIVLFNSAAERILDLTRDQAIGQNVSKLAGIYGSSANRWTQLIQDWSKSAEHPQFGDENITEQVTLGEKIIQTQLSPVYIGDLFLGTVSVFRDITKDVEADRAKSLFIANVSHEFRTPLTPIKGFTDLLLMNASGDLNEMQLQMIKTIKDNTQRLEILVEDVLNISKLDSGESAIHMSLVDLHELVPEIVEEIAEKPSNQEKIMHYTINIADNVPPIRADKDKVGDILHNVVENAFNYTLQNGQVSVVVERLADTESIRIAVADSGVGIPEDFREAVWRRFERHDQTAVTLDVAGTGLGLSLAKELVRLHNGDIWFESEVGVGTTFYIRLPIEQTNFRTSTAEMPAVDETTESIAGD
jgi:PAS domain S-box-containing protein